MATASPELAAVMTSQVTSSRSLGLIISLRIRRISVGQQYPLTRLPLAMPFDKVSGTVDLKVPRGGFVMRYRSVLAVFGVLLAAITLEAQVQPPPAPWRGAGPTPCVGSD